MQNLTRDELLRLLRVAKEASERDWLMCLVGYWHGLRASEVTGLRRNQIASGYITVQRLKGSLKTTQRLFEDEEPLLNERAAIEVYINGLAPDQRLFPVTRQHFWRLFQSWCKRADIPAHKRHPHVLKHSIGAHSIHGAGIENVRQHLGHKSIASTGAYLRVDDEQAGSAIAKAVAKKS